MERKFEFQKGKGDKNGNGESKYPTSDVRPGKNTPEVDSKRNKLNKVWHPQLVRKPR